MNVQPLTIGADAEAALALLNYPQKQLPEGRWVITGDFFILTGEAAIFAGDDEMYSWADRKATWRQFSTGQTPLTLHLYTRSYIATTNPYYQVEDVSRDVSETNPQIPRWVQNTRISVGNTANVGMLGGVAQGLSPTWWDISVSPNPTEFYAVQEDIFCDTCVARQPAVGAVVAGFPTWLAISQSPWDFNTLNLIQVANVGDTNTLQMQFEDGALAANAASSTSTAFVVALTAGLAAGTNASIELDLNSPNLIALLVTQYNVPWVIPTPIAPFSVALGNLVSAAGIVVLPYDADQVFVGDLLCSVAGISGNKSTSNILPNTSLHFYNSQSLRSGVAPRYC